MAKAFKSKLAFSAGHYRAFLYRSSRPRGAVKGRIQRGRVSGGTWHQEEMASAIRPRVLHNQTSGHSHQLT